MAQNDFTAESGVWPVNELGEIVFSQTGSGSTNITGFIPANSVPSDPRTGRVKAVFGPAATESATVGNDLTYYVKEGDTVKFTPNTATGTITKYKADGTVDFVVTNPTSAVTYGPYSGTIKFVSSVSVGSIDAVVQDAVVGVPERLNASLPPAINQSRSPGSLKITTKDGRAYRNGQPFRNFGVNAHDLLIDYLAGGTAYINDLPTIAAYGVKLIRCSAGPIDGPLWISQVGTDGTAPVAGYLAKVRTFLNAAASAGIGVELVLFWSFAKICEALGTTQSDYLTAGSTTRTYMKNFATTMALNFANQPGLAMWDIGNEWFDSASVCKFATATADTTKDHFGALAGTTNDVVDGIRVWDMDRSIVSPSGANGYFQSGQLSQFIPKLIMAAGKCDIVAIHMYPDTDKAAGGYDHAFIGMDMGSTEIFFSVLRNACAAAGKVLMMEECCGEYDNTTWGASYIGALADQTYSKAISAGVELMMDWGWYAAGGGYAGDLKVGRRAVMDKIASINSTLPQSFVPPSSPYPAMGAFKAPALCARGKGTTSSYIRIPNDPSLSLATGTAGKFWIMFWVRKQASLAAAARIFASNDGTAGMLLTPDNGDPALGQQGWNFQQFFSSGVQSFIPGSLAYPANALISPLVQQQSEWVHMGFFFDGTQRSGGATGWSDNKQHFTVWINGVSNARMAPSAVRTVSALTTRDLFLMSSSDGLSNFAQVDICDVITAKDSDLTSEMVKEYFVRGTVPVGAQHRWTMDGNVNDSIGTLNAVIGTSVGVPQVTFVPSGLGSL